MDWRAALTTFGLVFLAEIGDKTQLSIMAMSAQQRSPLAVWIGAALALALTSLLAVALGATLSRYVHPRTISITAGVVFLVFGMLLVTGRV